jgi:hypothetical protein
MFSTKTHFLYEKNIENYCSIGQVYKYYNPVDSISLNMIRKKYIKDLSILDDESRKILDDMNVKAYGPGYHSFLDHNRAASFSKNKIVVIGKFIIPKGSEYIDDDTGYIISNRIIFI